VPIPMMIPESHAIAIVNRPAAFERPPAPAFRRNFAYSIDFCLVSGCASYASIFFSLLLLSAHANVIGSLGKGAEAAFLDAYELAGAQLFAGSFAFFSLMFWVAVPLVAGKTFGMGICGLRLEAASEGGLTTRALLRRLAGCWINYLTLGAASVPALVQNSGLFFQDRVSNTRVVVDE
jgi:hypothetical protein